MCVNDLAQRFSGSITILGVLIFLGPNAFGDAKFANAWADHARTHTSSPR
jgi:hypothetical protein